jgi:hypothetical protein
MTTHDLASGPITLLVTAPHGVSGEMIASTPGGRLTLVAGEPEMDQDNIDYSSEELHYAPFASDTAAVFDTYQWRALRFTSGPFDQNGLSMAGGSKWLKNTPRDVFIISVDGEAKLATGPAWPAKDEDARNLTRRNGVWVTSANMVLDTSETSSVDVEAHCATWVGSINPTEDGVLTASFTLGQSRRCDVWNLYFQCDITLGVQQPPVNGEPVEYEPANQYPAWMAINNDLNNCATYFTGRKTSVSVRYLQRGFIDSLNAHGPCAAMIVICKGNISKAVGTFGSLSSDTSDDAMGFSAMAEYKDRSSIGAHKVIMAAANANNTTGTTLWCSKSDHSVYPQENYQVMWVTYQG